MVQNLKNIILDELKNIFSDSGVILIMLGAIFLYSIFYTIPYHNEVVNDVSVGVIDNDNSNLSRKFIREINATPNIEITQRPLNVEEAKELYYKNKIYAFFVIPKNFERDIKRGQSTFISAYLDNAYIIIYKQTAGAILTVATNFGAQIEALALMKKGLNRDRAFCAVSPFEFIENPLFNPSGGYETYLFSQVLILILQQTLILGVLIVGSTTREKMKGLRISKDKIEKREKYCEYSDNPYLIVLSKSIVHVVVYFIYAMIYFYVFPAFLRYEIHYNFFAMILILIPYLFSCSFLAQGLLRFIEKREYGFLVVVVTSVPFIYLSGFIWAKSAMPLILEKLSNFIPFVPAVQGLLRINQFGASFSDVKPSFIVLIILCLIYFIFAVSTAKKFLKSKK